MMSTAMENENIKVENNYEISSWEDEKLNLKDNLLRIYSYGLKNRVLFKKSDISTYLW